ncbi:MAG: hypothetical protein MHM6MM_000914 [Cercozoa sp. M6MM]
MTTPRKGLGYLWQNKVLGSAVDQSLACHFTRSEEDQLLLRQGRRFRIMSTRAHQTRPLRVEFEFSVEAMPQQCCCVRRKKNETDALALLCDDQLFVIEYDRERHAIRTVLQRTLALDKEDALSNQYPEFAPEDMEDTTVLSAANGVVCARIGACLFLLRLNEEELQRVPLAHIGIRYVKHLALLRGAAAASDPLVCILGGDAPSYEGRQAIQGACMRLVTVSVSVTGDVAHLGDTREIPYDAFTFVHLQAGILVMTPKALLLCAARGGDVQDVLCLLESEYERLCEYTQLPLRLLSTQPPPGEVRRGTLSLRGGGMCASSPADALVVASEGQVCGVGVRRQVIVLHHATNVDTGETFTACRPSDVALVQRYCFVASRTQRSMLFEVQVPQEIASAKRQQEKRDIAVDDADYAAIFGRVQTHVGDTTVPGTAAVTASNDIVPSDTGRMEDDGEALLKDEAGVSLLSSDSIPFGHWQKLLTALDKPRTVSDTHGDYRRIFETAVLPETEESDQLLCEHVDDSRPLKMQCRAVDRLAALCPLHAGAMVKDTLVQTEADEDRSMPPCKLLAACGTDADAAICELSGAIRPIIDESVLLTEEEGVTPIRDVFYLSCGLVLARDDSTELASSDISLVTEETSLLVADVVTESGQRSVIQVTPTQVVVFGADIFSVTLESYLGEEEDAICGACVEGALLALCLQSQRVLLLRLNDEAMHKVALLSDAYVCALLFDATGVSDDPVIAFASRSGRLSLHSIQSDGTTELPMRVPVRAVGSDDEANAEIDALHLSHMRDNRASDSVATLLMARFADGTVRVWRSLDKRFVRMPGARLPTTRRPAEQTLAERQRQRLDGRDPDKRRPRAFHTVALDQARCGDALGARTEASTGVIVCGWRPMMLRCVRDALLAHELYAPAGIATMTATESGFCLLSRGVHNADDDEDDRRLQRAHLPVNVCTDTELPMRRVSLPSCTPTKLVVTKEHVVVAASTAEGNRLYLLRREENLHLVHTYDLFDEDERITALATVSLDEPIGGLKDSYSDDEPPTQVGESKHSVRPRDEDGVLTQLLQQQTLHAQRHLPPQALTALNLAPSGPKRALQRHQRQLDAARRRFRDWHKLRTRRRVFIAVGTGQELTEGGGESRGRLLLLRVQENELDTAFFRAEVRPVTALASAQGCLVAALCEQVLQFRWNGEQLVGAAWHQAESIVSEIAVCGRVLVVADLFSSVQVASLETRNARIALLGRDTVPLGAVACSYSIVNIDKTGTRLFEVLLADKKHNLVSMALRTKSPPAPHTTTASLRPLVHVADFGDVAPVSQLLRFRTRRDLAQDECERFGNLVLGLDGSVSALTPMLEEELNTLIRASTLLKRRSPVVSRHWRKARIEPSKHQELRGNIVDGEVFYNNADDAFVPGRLCTLLDLLRSCVYVCGSLALADPAKETLLTMDLLARWF